MSRKKMKSNRGVLFNTNGLRSVDQHALVRPQTETPGHMAMLQTGWGGKASKAANLNAATLITLPFTGADDASSLNDPASITGAKLGKNGITFEKYYGSMQSKSRHRLQSALWRQNMNATASTLHHLAAAPKAKRHVPI